MTRNYWPSWLIATGLLCSPLTLAQEGNNVPRDPYARDLLILTDWFEGEFDNEEQLWFEADPRSETPEDGRHTRLHTMHRRVDLPEFGAHVFYVEEYKDNDPEDLVRQRLVIFSSEGLGGAIRMQQGFFKDPEEARGAQFEPSKLSDLRSDDVTFLDECDVFWRRVAGQYEGQMRPKACVFGDGDKRRYSVHNLILSETKYWRNDLTRLVADDSLYVGFDESQPTKLRRARPYVCEVNVRLDDGSSQHTEGLRLHSQGGEQTITRRDNGERYVLRMRDKEYPFYDTRPDFLFLSIRKEGERRSLAYSVGDAESRRLGFSYDGVLAHCYREGYTFRQSPETL